MRRGIQLPDPPGAGLSSSCYLSEIFEKSLVRRAVVIGNGIPGAENQSIALVRALGLTNSYTLYRVERPQGGFNRWLRWLPLGVHKRIDALLSRFYSRYSRLAASFLGSQPKSIMAPPSPPTIPVEEADAWKLASLAQSEIEKNGPLLVLASGRDTVPIAELLKKLAPSATFVVQIQHPRRDLNKFDMVVTPVHDYYPLTPAARREVPAFLVPFLSPHQPPDRRVVLTLGALHLADAAMLRTAAEAWHSQLAPLPKPLLIVNIGGPTRHCNYGQELVRELISKLKRVVPSCGSIRISYSRRTPEKMRELIRAELDAFPQIYIYDNRDTSSANPHLGHLAWGDAFVITADSISMLSEACSTGKPVYVIGAEKCTWKFKSFQESLKHKGVARNFTGTEDMSESWSYPPINDAALAADRLRAALAERGWTL